MVDKNFWVSNSGTKKVDKNFWVGTEAKTLPKAQTTVSTVQPSATIPENPNRNSEIENRMSELNALMKETDTKIRRPGYTEAERAELNTQYKTYKDEYYKLKNELNAKIEPIIDANTTRPDSNVQITAGNQNQTLGDKAANFFKVTLPTAAQDAWDDIKYPITGPSAKQLLTESKLSPELLKKDAEIQLAKEDPTWRDYALIKPTKDIVEKYGMEDSNIKAISGDNAQLLKDLERAEKTYQASPIDATVANVGAAGMGILGDVAGFANMLGADEIPVVKDLTASVINTANRLQENAQQYNVGTYGGYMGNLTQVITRMIPYFIAGTGKVVTTGGKVAKFVASTVKNPSFWISFTTIAGQKYNENVANGVDRWTATINALTTAIPSALVEVAGGVGSQGKEAQSLLKTIFEENLEEITQGIIEKVSDKFTTKPDMKLYSTTEEAIINPKEMGEEMLYTTPATLLTGGTSRVIQNAQTAKANKEIADMRARYQTRQAMEDYKQTSPYAKYQPTQVDTKISSKDIKPRTGLPEGGKIYVDENGVAVDSRNYVAPSENNVQNVKYSPVNARQVMVNPLQQENAVKNAEVEKNVAPESPTNAFQEPSNQTILPTQKIQETVNSAKIAGMSDFDIKKATDLHKMLRSGANLKFYDSKNVPAGVDARAVNANGFYLYGTLWINKDSKRQVEKILGHELTHHLESTKMYNDFANSILDSNLFYDYITSQGYDNVAQFKENLRQRGYNDQEMDSEMVSMFVEDNLFDSQEKIDRLARENRTLAQKILNWLSDMKTRLVGTSQEKELLRIENMYRKALEQAGNTETMSNKAQYSYSGEVGLQNLEKNYGKMNRMQKEFVNELENNYQNALYLSQKGYTNEEILDKTGWFKSDDKWKWEIPDEYFKLKEDADLSNGLHDLADLVQHDLIFMVYPELRTQKVKISNSEGKSFYTNGTIYLKIGGKEVERIETSLLHELQHAIQEIEGFDGGTSPWGGMLRYYEKHGEIEADDTVQRFKRGKVDETFDREKVAPELSKPNPKHSLLDDYLAGKTKTQTPLRDKLYQKYKEKGNGIYEKADRKALGMEVDETDNGKDMRVDNGGRRVAGKGPAFSLPETDNQGRKLTAEQQEFFKDSKARDEDGNLQVAYHGTYNGEFYIFDKDKANPENDFGKGFYLTTDLGDVQGNYEGGGPDFDRKVSKLAERIQEEEDVDYDKAEEIARERLYVDSNLIEAYVNIKNPAIVGETYLFTEDDFEDALIDMDIDDYGGNEDAYYEDADYAKADYVANNILWGMDDVDGIEEVRSVICEAMLDGGIGVQEFKDKMNEVLMDAGDEEGNLISSEVTRQIIENLGYDGIIDPTVSTKFNMHIPKGTKHYIVFNSNQIKNVDNTNPTENADIRYSINPIEIAKNPPHPQSGLDALKRAGKEKTGNAESSFARNIYNQNIFDGKFKDMALNDKNIKTYDRITNKETLQEANDAINEQGQKWVDRFLDKSNGDMKATDIAGGIILMNRYQEVGDYESMIRIAEKLRKAGTQQGQTIQLFSILGRMTPEGMTYYAQKELSKAYEEIVKNKTQKWADEHKDEFKLTEKDVDFIQRRVNQAAKLPEGRDKYVLLAEIAERIQGKIPPQPGQGLKALARNSMLLNPKTMIRNVLGNVVIVPNHIVSDFIGAGIDKAISNKTGVRTTGTFKASSLEGVKKGFYESFDDFRRHISTREMSGDRFELGKGGKSFYENHTGILATQRNALSKALNGLDRVTGFLLESGDRPFYETWFINSLNNQMELNNASMPTAEMIEIATDEALQRTWQDNNAYTNFVSSLRNGANKINIKGYGLGDMVMPFVKTPANLTKAVVDFSPLGVINALVKTSEFNKAIGRGEATAKQQRAVVKSWSQVITGTLGMAIMTALAKAGILSGGSDEDKDVRNFEQNILGIKPYSIKIGDKSYTYDWAQPLGTSAAMVADTVKSLKNAKDTESKLSAILNGLESGASVLLEQALVSGIRNLFEEDNLINGLIEIGLNEPAKFTPQFLSQIAQIQDDTARTSYVYNNPLQTAKNKIKAKIPGQRQTLEPSVDVLGREVKTDNSVANVMFNPANTAFARTTKGAEEMYRVYKETGDKGAIAQVAPYYFNADNEKIVLTPKQKTQYQKTTGKIASDGVENLLNINAYKSLADEDKAEILKDLYSYANAIAKAEASDKYTIPKEYQKIKESGMKPEEYILMKNISSSGGLKKDEMYNALTQSGYSKSKTERFLTDYKGYKFDGTNALPTLSNQTKKLPTLKK